MLQAWVSLSLQCRYRAAAGRPESTDRQRAQITTMLPGWHLWAKRQPDLTKADRRMCRGPDAGEPVIGFDQASIAGVDFACFSHEKDLKGKRCTIMVRAGLGRLAVGQIRLLMEWLPPWKGEPVEVVDVQWYGSKGTNAELCGAPQVTKAFKLERGCNLCLAEEIIPSYVCLVPHLKHAAADWWQVLYLGDPVM